MKQKERRDKLIDTHTHREHNVTLDTSETLKIYILAIVQNVAVDTTDVTHNLRWRIGYAYAMCVYGI